jgi:hypothetical protein
MSTHKRHDRHNNSRTFSGQDLAGRLLDFLNQPIPPGDDLSVEDYEFIESRQRVVTIISAIREKLVEIEKDPEVLIYEGDNYSPDEDHDSADLGWEEWEDAPAEFKPFEGINRLLSDYKSFPVLVADKTNPQGWAIDRVFLLSGHITDAMAVEAALRLLHRGLFGNLQNCQCGSWFLRKFAHQRFCSSKCREQYWENSDERKAQKRDRAREYYQFHKIHRG